MAQSQPEAIGGVSPLRRYGRRQRRRRSFVAADLRVGRFPINSKTAGRDAGRYELRPARAVPQSS